MLFILEASLQDIVDRWADGKASNTSGVYTKKIGMWHLDVVQTQVEIWMSFKELLFILEASLQDIREVADTRTAGFSYRIRHVLIVI